jgi:hypothetical protein
LEKLEIDEKYGLGKERTLKEYQDFCGIDFEKQLIKEKAKCGGLPKTMFLNNAIDKVLELLSANSNIS